MLPRAAFVIALVLVSVGSARSQVALSATTEADLVVDPGDAVTIPIAIQAPPGEYHPIVALPDGWRLLLPEGPFEVGAGGVQRLLTVVAPAAAEAGRYTIGYTLEEAPPEAAVEVPLTVRARREIAVRAQPGPRYVPAGDTLTVSFTVENTGNVPATVDVDLSNVRWEVIPETIERDLAPRQADAIEVRIPVPAGLPGRDVVQIVARAQDRNAPETVVRARTRVTAFPVVADGELAYHRYRAQVGLRTSVRQFGGDVGALHVLSASGGGELHESSPISGGFDIRYTESPGSARLVPLSRNHYSGYLDVGGLRVAGGDVLVPTPRALSLTGDGRGALGEIQLKGWTGLGYYVRDVYGTGHRVGGARISSDWGGGEAAVSYTRRLDLWDAHAGGASVAFALGDLRVRGDAAATVARDGVGVGGVGAISYTGSFFSATVDAGGANETFAGLDRDSERIAMSVRVSPWDVFAVNGQANFTRRGTSTSRGWRFGGQLGTFARASYGEQDLDVGGGSRITRRTAEGSVQVRGARASVLGAARLSSTAAGAASASYFDGSLTTAALVAPALQVSVGGRYRWLERPGPLSAPDSTTVTSTEMSGLLGATLRFSDTTSLSGDFSYGVAGEPGAWATLLAARASFRHVLPSGHRLAVFANQQSSGGSAFNPALSFTGREFEPFSTSGITVQYTLPFNVPVHRSRRTGAIEGRLVDGETGRGIPGVPVVAGREGALTDDAGNFWFSRLRPGTYTLQVDARRIGLDRTLEEDVREVHVAGGGLAAVQFSAVRAAAVEGRVNVIGRDGPVPLADAVLELTLPSGETTYRFTDGDGQFSFRNLKPGRHTVTILSQFLPERHEVVEDRLDVVLRPGATSEVEFDVTRIVREVQFQEELPASSDRTDGN